MRYLCVLAGLTAGLAIMAGPEDDRSREEAAEAERTCAAELPRWQLMADGVTLDTPTAPVLRWTNPSAGRVYGNTYVWFLRGRPTAVWSMYRYFTPFQSFNGELAALIGPRLVARRNDKVVWRPQEEWRWRALPGSAAPAATAPQRLVQMRELAREFTVQVLDTRNVPKGEDQSPRLLPRPLYRYDAKLTKALDGALYAFVLGTDPELTLLLECDTAAARPDWRFGIGRMNRDAIRVLRKGEKVWEAPALTGDGFEEAYCFLDLGLQRRKRSR
jgi:hypothetical protein